MAIKRQKIVRKVDLVLDGNNVVDMPPGWVFTFECEHYGLVRLDFSPHRRHGRDNFAAHMRDAFWNLRRELVGRSLENMERHLRYFSLFLDDLAAAGEIITRLDQIDRRLLDRFLAWLAMRVSTRGQNKGRGLSVGIRKAAFGAIKTALTNRQRCAPDAVNPELGFPKNPFPNQKETIQKRKAYSATEQKRIVEALNADLALIHEGGEAKALPPMQVLVVHLLLLALATGRNFQSLIELQRDSLREHPLSDRELLVTTKRRGWSTHATSVRKAARPPENMKSIRSIPSAIGDHFRFLCEFTAPLVGDASEKDRPFVFLWRLTQREHKGEVIRLSASGHISDAVTAFSRRHALLDDQGEPLMLNVARMRPTFATELYRRTRDIRRVSQALGHASVDITARHYVEVPPEAERDHAIIADAMVSAFSRQEVGGKVLLAADGAIPLQDVKDLLSGGYNTGIARCKNPFRENESVCKKFFACFKCPSMCVFEDDLWRLFSFYYRLLAERAKINAAQWIKTYGPIIRRIDSDIASQFPATKVDAARRKALDNPHPTWRGIIL